MEYSEWFCIESSKWGASCKPTCSMFSPAVLFSVFSLFCCVFLCCVFSLCCYLSLASSMAVAWLSLFRICSRNSVCRLGLHWPLPIVASWWSQWGSCDREFTIIHVTVDPWRGVQLPLLFDCHCCSYCKCVYFGFLSLLGFCFMVLCSQFGLSFSGNFCDLMKKC